MVIFSMSQPSGGKNRFVIVCTARTGSNLLVRSLNRPPRTRCFGEVAKASFASEADAFAQFERLSGRGATELAAMQIEDVGSFIYDVIFELSGDTVGFKIFYEHCREPGRAGIWDRLVADAGLRVIHLTRNATFDTYLSLLYAQRTDQWFIRRDHADSPPNDLDDIDVDLEHCRSFLQSYLDKRRKASALFGGHTYMEIDYSALETDLAGALAEIRHFIGAPTPKEDPVPLRKQAARPAHEKVRNYFEVVETLRGAGLADLL